MNINNANLKTLFVAFNSAFKEGLAKAESQFGQISTTVPSTTGREEYGWLGSLPGMREWLGDRVVHGIGNHGYTIKNRPFELTVGVPREAIEDDQYGVYSPMMNELGAAAGRQPDEMMFGLLKNGTTGLCYDGQPFFSKTHPRQNAARKTVVVSNLDDSGGANAPYWYVLDTTRTLKPLIYQTRKAPNFVAMTAETDDNVFRGRRFEYGVDCRRNGGYGFWQLAYASNAALTEDSLKAAISAMEGMLGDFDAPLAIKPTLLVVPTALRWTATSLLKDELVPNAAGTATKSNTVRNALEMMVSPWLK